MAFRKEASRKRTSPRRLGRGLDSLVSVAMPLERLPEPASRTPLADPAAPPRGQDPAGELRANPSPTLISRQPLKAAGRE